ncbi:NADH dehydrogenase [ubiquinone] iron-sulfur protein 5 [Branchiostoma belcheri]|nr:NADH dehydrogenase [ubiquinone] iron-sulfur protein 5 [Branchiostoma belcheri]
MPLLNLGHKWDNWMLSGASSDDKGQTHRCFHFEKEFIECASGIGKTRAIRECKPEYMDFLECIHMIKQRERLRIIRERRDKLIKEGKYTPPEYTRETLPQ